MKETVYNIITFSIFFLIFNTIYFFLNYYIYYKVVTGLQLSSQIKLYIKLGFWLLGSSFIIGHILGRFFGLTPLIYIGSVWLGIIAISFTVFIFKDIILLVFPFSKKITTIISLTVIFITAVYSFWNASRPPRIKNVKIESRKVSSKIKGYKIVHLSDLHLGMMSRVEWVKMIVSMVNQQNPDLIVITGDLIDSPIRHKHKVLKIFKKLKAKHGIYAVTGNHEFYEGIDHFNQLVDYCGIKVLNNESKTIAEAIELAGVPDRTGRRYKGFIPDLDKALKRCNLQNMMILLNHQPLGFHEAVHKGIDLQLSGHIHVGQLPPLDILVYILFKYPYGLYQYKSSYIYTTSGTGNWGPPMRFSSRNEIVVLTLE